MVMSLAEDIKHKAIELGFDLVGITRASPIDAEQVKLLTDWLKSGYAGQMTYMHRNFEKRIDPAKLLKNAQSVICLGLNYKPPKRSPSLRALRSNLDPRCHCERSEAISTPAVIASEAKQSHLHSETAPMGRVANYAQYEDYHLFIKKQLRKLTEFITSIAGEDLQFKICVDSATLAERALAARAGLGFIGKNRMLINPTLGAQIFLGEIITDLKLKPDEPTFCHPERSLLSFRAERSAVEESIKNCHSERIFCHSERSEESIQSTTTKCSNCNKCIDACPTGALRPDGQFDANKCISYLTVEYKGQIPPDLAEKVGARLFGCDECVLACPYQENAPVCKNKQFKFYIDRARLNLQEVLSLSAESFEAEFADSPIKRLGLDRLKRNAKICLANITR